MSDALIYAAMRLGAGSVKGWSAQERALVDRLGSPDRLRRRELLTDIAPERTGSDHSIIAALRERILNGADPLGHAFINHRVAAARRTSGVTYTPRDIVRAMATWAGGMRTVERIVDPGVGSARFLLEVAPLFPAAALLGVEIDPLAALLARANLAAAGLARRARIEVADYRQIDLRSAQRTLYIGNPPYVRHHLISKRWKDWFVRRWRELGIDASRLAGTHLHFFLATLLSAKAGDCGAFVTAAEWLDVNYGATLRKAFLGSLGGLGLIIIEPTARPFPDATTTAAIALFRIGAAVESLRVLRVRRTARLGNLTAGRQVKRRHLELQSRWSQLGRAPAYRSRGLIELGELCRVHRGQATGANEVWIAGASAGGLPDKLLLPTVTRARELITAGKLLHDSASLRRVVDLPEDLDELDAQTRRAVERFLRHARRHGAHTSYLARHRRAWWSVGLRSAAPILTTYMARRAPVFTRNAADARHLNIAHGLYPRAQLTEAQLRALIEYLSLNVSVTDGRTYAGGLTKFEPREMERLLVPRPESLAGGAQGL